MILYEQGTTDFTKNGLGYLPNVLSASVIDEINGEYSLRFEYPINDDMASEIVEDRIVKCQVADSSKQCFVIKTIQKDFDKMSVYCTHLFYLLNDDFLDDVYPQNLSPKLFLEWLLDKANYSLPFAVNSDIVTTASARYVRKNIVEAILGNIDNSMYNLFGMELKRNNWNIGLKARIGSDKGEKLIFGKNISGVDINIDTTGVYTRIMPIGFDGLLIPEKYVDASNINDYPYPRICLYEFPDIRYDPDDPSAYPTEAAAQQALRDAVNDLYAKGINKPQINIQVNWLELSKTEEYKQYSALERVDLGDTITCELFGMDYETRVIKTTYNPLTDRVEKFEIGTIQPSILTTMNQTSFDVQQINPTSILEQATENATNLITQAMGGYVYKTNSELYIMDNPDPAQAVKVWRWNLNGLGYSSTGINGTYALAMTMDGSIVADFVTTGQLSANVISAATIIGVINGNSSQLQIDADQININGVVSANNNFKILNDGSVEINNGNLDLIDDGTTSTPSKISITSLNNNLISKLYSSGLYLISNDGYQLNETSVSYTGYSHKMTDLSTNRFSTTDVSQYGQPDIYLADYDANSNLERWAFLFPGSNLDSAFKLGYSSNTNVEISNHQSGSFVKVKGDYVATDSNGNETFSVTGTNGLIATPTHKQYYLGSNGDNNYPSYYLLAKLPVDNAANHSVLRINGSLGGWSSENKIIVDFSITNRDGLKVDGNFYGDNRAFGKFDFKLYKYNDEIYVYLHRVEQYVSEVILDITAEEVEWYGETSTSNPSGSLEMTINELTLNNNNVYSSNEIKVGTYVDGKPIYRIVLETTGNNSNYQDIGYIADLDNVIRVDCWAKNGATRRNVTCSDYFGDVQWASQIFIDWGYLKIECGNYFLGFKNGATIKAIVEYTKTTD